MYTSMTISGYFYLLSSFKVLIDLLQKDILDISEYSVNSRK